MKEVLQFGRYSKRDNGMENGWRKERRENILQCSENIPQALPDGEN
jgi:hypothetical protein